MSTDRSRPSRSCRAPAALAMQPALAFAALMVLSAGPATSEEARHAAAPRAHRVHSHIECTCRALGRDHAVGTTICLNNALFRCGMDLNVTSWQAEGQPCPQS